MDQSVVAKAEKLKMDEILRFLLTNFSFVYNDYGFKFVDSMSSKSFGGDGYITLQSDHMEIRILSDRNQMFLDFRSLKYDKKNDWHSIDVIKQLITGNVCDNAVLDEKTVSNVKDNFSDICELFAPPDASETVSELKKLEFERSKRLFG